MLDKALKLIAGNMVVMLSLTLGVAAAGAPSKSHKAGGHVTSTGCLAKGDEADEYSITGADGKTYGLRSKTVALADHLGHKVTVSGTITKGEENEANEKKEGAKKEVADVRVTSLKMVSTTCP